MKSWDASSKGLIKHLMTKNFKRKEVATETMQLLDLLHSAWDASMKSVVRPELEDVQDLEIDDFLEGSQETVCYISGAGLNRLATSAKVEELTKALERFLISIVTTKTLQLHLIYLPLK